VETAPAQVGGWVPAQNRTDTLKSHRCEVEEIVHNRVSIHFWYTGAMRKSIQPQAAGFSNSKQEALGSRMHTKTMRCCPRRRREFEAGAHIAVACTMPHCSECALSGLGDGVPSTFLNQRGFTALATRRRACVATTLTTASLTWEEISIHVLAADVSPAYTDIATAAIATSTHELCALSVVASSGWQSPPHFRVLLVYSQEYASQFRINCVCESALGIIGDGVPPTFLNRGGFAALATGRRACVATALAAVPLAGEGVSIHVLATDISLPHTDIATATIATSAHELCALPIVASSGRQPPPRFRVLLVYSQKRVLRFRIISRV